MQPLFYGMDILGEACRDGHHVIMGTQAWNECLDSHTVKVLSDPETHPALINPDLGSNLLMTMDSGPYVSKV